MINYLPDNLDAKIKNYSQIFSKILPVFPTARFIIVRIPFYIILFSCAIFFTYQNCPGNDCSNSAGDVYNVGKTSTVEKIEYKIMYTKLPAGKLIFEKAQSDNPAHEFNITLTAQTVSGFKKLFLIDNKYISSVDSNTILPIVLKKSIRQKNIEQNMTIFFDHDQLKAQASENFTWLIKSDTRDFVSLIYYLRKYPIANRFR